MNDRKRVLTQQLENAKRAALMVNSNTFILSKNEFDASFAEDESINEKGVIQILYPPSSFGYEMEIRLMRVFIVTNFDLRQVFLRSSAIAKDPLYLQISDVKTTINERCQDLITHYSLGTYDWYDDYTFKVKWKKKLQFKKSDNSSEIGLWYEAIGLTVNTIYNVGDTTSIPLEKIKLSTPFVLNVAINNDNSSLSMYGERTALLTMGQFQVNSPKGYQIVYYANKTAETFVVKRKKAFLEIELVLKNLNITLNKFCLNTTRIEIDFKGKII